MVDDRLAVGEGGDQSLNGEVVDRSRKATAGLVDESEGVVAEENVLAAGDGEMVLHIGDGLGQVHAVEVVAEGNPLIERGIRPELQTAAQRGLADQKTGEESAEVHLGAEEETQLFELGGGQEVSLVTDDDDAATSLGALRVEALCGSGDEGGALIGRDAAEGTHDVPVIATGGFGGKVEQVGDSG